VVGAHSQVAAEVAILAKKLDRGGSRDKPTSSMIHNVAAA
jgi:hypothetical protein